MGGKALQYLRSQDSHLRGPALHIALVLDRAGILKALAAPDVPPNIASIVRDYVAHFGPADQLIYFRILERSDRVQELQRMLLRGGAGTNDELLGYVDGKGRHR